MWIILMLLAATVAVFLYQHWKLNKLEPEAKSQFLNEISCFSDCLTPLLDTVSREDDQRMNTQLKIWRRRMDDTAVLQAYFDRKLRYGITPLRKGYIWLQTLECWGLKHDTPGVEKIITKEYQTFYFFDDIYQLGDTMKVVNIAWWVTIDGCSRCICRGTAEVQEETL